MYIPSPFAETRTQVMHDLIHAHPLATLVIHTSEGLQAHHIPLLLDATNAEAPRLQGHVARANPLWRDCISGIDALAIFRAADAYVTPNWYATKRETGKVVPTWNYVVVHAHGHLRAIDDTDWLRAHLEKLVAVNEAREPAPWKISDAPDEYIATQLKHIVGIEIAVTRLEGKWKVSQNHPQANRAGVVAGLESRGRADDATMAQLVRERDK